MEKLNKSVIVSDILNGMSTNEFIACLFWSTIGIIASTLIEIIRHKKSIKASGGFSIKIWASDNIPRAVLSMIAVICGILFAPNFLNIDKGIFGALMAGLVTDKIIEALIQFKDNFNISALWTKK